MSEPRFDRAAMGRLAKNGSSSSVNSPKRLQVHNRPPYSVIFALLASSSARWSRRRGG